MAENARAVRLRVGRNVRQLRILRGWSQERLAEAVGNTYKHIGQVERGEVNVGLDVLTAIANSLSVKVADLIDSAVSDRIETITPREREQIERTLQILRRWGQPERRRGWTRPK